MQMCRVVYLCNATSVTKIFCYQYSTINNFAMKLYFSMKFCGQLSNLLGILLFRFVEIWHFYCTMSRGLLFYRTQCSVLWCMLLPFCL